VPTAAQAALLQAAVTGCHSLSDERNAALALHQRLRVVLPA
jgi:hypothetical protein